MADFDIRHRQQHPDEIDGFDDAGTAAFVERSLECRPASHYTEVPQFKLLITTVRRRFAAFGMRTKRFGPPPIV